MSSYVRAMVLWANQLNERLRLLPEDSIGAREWSRIKQFRKQDGGELAKPTSGSRPQPGTGNIGIEDDDPNAEAENAEETDLSSPHPPSPDVSADLAVALEYLDFFPGDGSTEGANLP